MLRLTALACALTTTVLSVAACSTEPATPQAALTSRLEVMSRTPDGVDVCPLSGEWIKIGNFRGPGQNETELVLDGADQGGVPVKVDCAVVDNGGSFQVDIKGEVEGTEGGVVQLSGSFSPSGKQEGVSVTFGRADYGAYIASDCTVSYYAAGEDESQPSFRGVAAGRVWGFLSCPEVKSAERNRACRANMQFRFENCAQE